MPRVVVSISKTARPWSVIMPWRGCAGVTGKRAKKTGPERPRSPGCVPPRLHFADPCLGALFILIAGHAAYSYGADDLAADEDWHPAGTRHDAGQGHDCRASFGDHI